MCALRAGYPRPRADAVKWVRVPERAPLALSQRADETGTVLLSSALKPDDAGVYRCFVDSGALSADQVLQPNASELTLRLNVVPKSRPPGIQLTPSDSLLVLEGSLLSALLFAESFRTRGHRSGAFAFVCHSQAAQ